jgi:hypothetical protein
MGWSKVNSKQIKLASAVFGAGAVVAMGAFAIGSTNSSSAEPPVARAGDDVRGHDRRDRHRDRRADGADATARHAEYHHDADFRRARLSATFLQYTFYRQLLRLPSRRSGRRRPLVNCSKLEIEWSAQR